MLLAPDDVGDPHLQVIHDGGEVVGRRAVGLYQHKVLNPAEGHLAPQTVPETPGPLRRTEINSPTSFLIRRFID